MTTFFSYVVSLEKIDFGVWTLWRGGWDQEKCPMDACMKKLIYLSSLSVIIVHDFDCIKSRIPAEVVSNSSGNLSDSAGNH